MAINPVPPPASPPEWSYVYDSPCSLYTHPSQIAAQAYLSGYTPPPLEGARILEVGCACGGNLTPIAATLPESECIGIDPFEEQIQLAQQRSQELGLTNLTYLPIGIEDQDQLEGKFDYIICHGFFSWVSDDIRTAALKFCKDQLAEGGILYMSYNTYPHWHIYQIGRDLMRFRGRCLTDSEDFVDQAKKTIELYSKLASVELTLS